MSGLGALGGLGVLCGVGIGVGLIGVWSAFWEPSPLRFVGSRSGVGSTTRLPGGVELVPLLVGVLVAVVGALVTGRLVTFCAIGIALVVVPTLVKGSGSEARFAQTTDAVAAWVESLRDLMRGAHGIEGALRASTESVGRELRDPVVRLNRRRDAGVDISEALVLLADDVKNPVMDVAVTSLLSSLEHASMEIPQVLDELATRAREMAKDHRRVYVSRRRARTQLRLVAQILGGFLVIAMFALRSVVEPLTHGPGRAAVVVTMVWIGAMLLWIAQLSVIEESPRVLDPSRTLKAKKL